MSNVIVLQARSTVDISDAERFGTIIHLWTDQLDLEENPMEAVAVFSTLLSIYRPGDYILPLGDPSIILVAGFCLARMGYEAMNILRWDAKTRTYHPIRTPFDQGSMLEGLSKCLTKKS